MADLFVVVLIAFVAAAVGLGFGIVVVAPRIGRFIDAASQDEEDRDGRA
jgi:hypothetical protein